MKGRTFTYHHSIIDVAALRTLMEPVSSDLGQTVYLHTSSHLLISPATFQKQIFRPLSSPSFSFLSMLPSLSHFFQFLLSSSSCKLFLLSSHRCHFPSTHSLKYPALAFRFSYVQMPILSVSSGLLSFSKLDHLLYKFLSLVLSFSLLSSSCLFFPPVSLILSYFRFCLFLCVHF